MSTKIRTFAIAIVAALLMFGPAGLVSAQDEAVEPTSLTGCLLETEEGTYALDELEVEVEAEGDVAEEDSGEIALEGEGLDAHVGHTVTVTGDWAFDDEGGEYFEVASLEHVSESCEA